MCKITIVYIITNFSECMITQGNTSYFMLVLNFHQFICPWMNGILYRDMNDRHISTNIYTYLHKKIYFARAEREISKYFVIVHFSVTI